jgi:hypothetical protein
VAEVDRGVNESRTARCIERRLAQLHQPQAVFQRLCQGHQLRVDADLAGVADGVKIGQGQRRQHRRVGRQHRRHRQAVGALPGQGTMHVVVQLAAPVADAEEIQPDMGVFVNMLAAQPGVGARHADAEFLAQLAQQRGVRRLAGLDLAAGEFPVAGIEGARRALAEQEFHHAIRRASLDDGGGDFGDFSHFAAAGFFLACRPA